MRKFLIAGAAALALGGAAAAASAQDAPPTVKVALSKTAVTLEGAEALEAGPTRFEFTNAGGGKEQMGELLALAPGNTVHHLQEALPKGPAAVLRLGSLEVGTTLVGKSDKRTVTATLKPGVTYVMLQVAAENPSKWVYSAFTVGQETSTAVAPAPDATVRLVDFGFKGSKRLPRNGVVRFEHRGKAPHFVIAFPLRKGADQKAAVRAIKKNQEKRFERMAGGAPTEPQGLITGGAVNDTEVRFAKRGKYVLACFFSLGPNDKPHSARGMVRAVTVK